MQFTSTLLIAATALASMATAAPASNAWNLDFEISIPFGDSDSSKSQNIIHFVNQDSTQRTLYFTPNAGLAAIDPVVVPGDGTIPVTIPYAWIGNFYAIPEGSPNVPGMLGEVTYNGWDEINYFDVSAIVDPNDHNGVKMMFPKSFAAPISGCQTFPCANAYNLPDDIQTQTTEDSELVCLLGNLPENRRRGARNEKEITV